MPMAAAISKADCRIFDCIVMGTPFCQGAHRIDPLRRLVEAKAPLVHDHRHKMVGFPRTATIGFDPIFGQTRCAAAARDYGRGAAHSRQHRQPAGVPAALIATGFPEPCRGRTGNRSLCDWHHEPVCSPSRPKNCSASPSKAEIAQHRPHFRDVPTKRRTAPQQKFVGCAAAKPSSAVATSEAGIAMPRTFAALRLTIN
jgi:hypothetical protein